MVRVSGFLSAVSTTRRSVTMSSPCAVLRSRGVVTGPRCKTCSPSSNAKVAMLADAITREFARRAALCGSRFAGRAEVRGAHFFFKFALKKSIVRCHASVAAALS